MMAAGYSLDLYCDVHTNHPFKYFPHNFYDQTFARCKKEAVSSGWKFLFNGQHIRPLCTANGLKPDPKKGFMDSEETT